MADLKVKYRPGSFKTFLGNEETVEALKDMIRDDDLPHAILLTGPKGCGKTTLGRILKDELGCSNHDYRELDTAVFRGIGTVRDLRESLAFLPRQGKVKVYLIDEAHMLGKGGASEKNEAQNAILKSLEEPPDHVYWILCTTNPERLISTITDRCVKFSLAPLDKKDGLKLIKRVSKKEKKKIPAKVMQRIVAVAEGRPRSILSLMEKVLHLKTEKKMLKVCKAENLAENKAIIDLCRSLMKDNNWDETREILQGLKGEEPENVRRGIMGYAQSVLLNGNTDGALILGWFTYKSTYDAGFPLIVQFCYNVANNIEPPC